MRSVFPIGTRIRMSKLGAERCPGLAKKKGIVVSGSRNPSTVSVRFDGNSLRTRTMLHVDYIEPAETGPLQREPSPNSKIATEER
jgi:hypothetical protein